MAIVIIGTQWSIALVLHILGIDKRGPELRDQSHTLLERTVLSFSDTNTKKAAFRGYLSGIALYSVKLTSFGYG